jgi:pimeloyl-ACP methyl ester carboxylesterase
MNTALETDLDIRPFHVHIEDEALEDLRRRISATQWPKAETVADHSQGVSLAMMQDLARYWATEYDWRRCEAKSNALPQFVTEIYGVVNAEGVSIPVATTVFPGEQYHAPRSWTERAYPNLIYFDEVDRGGHFAAWEEPELFAAELRAAFRSLR